jgi:hypothetical protein
MSTVKNAPRARKKPKLQISRPEDMEELLDWDARIENPPHGPVRTVRIKFVKVPRQLPSFTEQDMD